MRRYLLITALAVGALAPDAVLLYAMQQEPECPEVTCRCDIWFDLEELDEPEVKREVAPRYYWER